MRSANAVSIWETEVQRGFRISRVICPERSESAAWRGAQAKPSTTELIWNLWMVGTF